MAHLAGLLAKADLVTGMVGEFPELQGIMGGYYARKEGLPDEVAQAIADHYKPAGPSDACPTAPVSVAVALADKLDTLVGFFTINEPPTGSRDPYALRRAALGIIRLICENHLRPQLLHWIREAQRPYDHHDCAPAVYAFIIERLKVAMREKNIRHDHIEAVMATTDESDIVNILHRVGAVQKFLASEDGEHLLTAYRRAANILHDESRKDGASYGAVYEDNLLAEPSEKDLGQKLRTLGPQAIELTETGAYEKCMALLATLRGPLDAFFEQVRVNDADPGLRRNRLKLLGAIIATFAPIADFSKIEG